jgi:hypothetical protein
VKLRSICTETNFGGNAVSTLERGGRPRSGCQAARASRRSSQ